MVSFVEYVDSFIQKMGKYWTLLDSVGKGMVNLFLERYLSLYLFVFKFVYIKNSIYSH